MSSDDQLALRAADGDRHAFEEIFNRYHQDLYRFCLAMVGNPQDAQDTLQNTMVKVLRGLPGEKRTIRLKPWLFRIARNESIETLRKRRDNVELEPQQVATAGVTETAETRERLRTLLADLEQLPERQRSALIMRELSGLDFDQIGAVFGSSAAVARQTLYEARLSLRQLEAGREMHCAEVMQELSDADGRITRRREIRAHLRSCPDCRAFRNEIGMRHEDLAALAPLPLAASVGVLQGVLGGKAAGSLAGAVGAGAGKAAATSAIVKTVATVAVVTTVGVTAADRGGLIDVPLPGKDGHVQVDRKNGAQLQDGQIQPARAGAKTSYVEVGKDAAVKAQGAETLHGQAGSPAAKLGADKQGAPFSTDSDNNSQSGSPPGGGYGRAASERRGRPDQLPDASNHGQETAGARKPEHASGTPNSNASSNGQGKSGAAAPPQGPAHKNSSPPSRSEPPGQSGTPPESGVEQPSIPPDEGSPGSFKGKGNGH